MGPLGPKVIMPDGLTEERTTGLRELDSAGQIIVTLAIMKVFSLPKCLCIFLHDQAIGL